MKKTFLFTLLMFSLFSSNASQNERSPEDEVNFNLASQILAFPQEKIYLQTDKPYYVSGEKVFFRAFLLHASLNKPLYLSRYVYVELINPMKEIVLRQQIRIEEDQMFYGALSLPEDLSEGYYDIRSYTRFMENTGEESFYNRSVFIAHPNSSLTELQTDIHYPNDKYVDLGLRFINRKSQTITLPKNILINTGKKKIDLNISPEDDGWIYQRIAKKDLEAHKTLLVEYIDGLNSISKFISVPYPNDQPEINFYPEGGSLIPELTNRIAFKALLPGGMAAKIEGAIYNSNGERLTLFSTFHEGMGDFYLEPKPEETYYAQYTHINKTIKVDLPQAKKEAVSLQAIQENDLLSISIRKNKDKALSKIYLLIHNQGIPLFFQEWNTPEEAVVISKDSLKVGVSHVILLDENLNPLSERLVFKSPPSTKVKIEADKNDYKKREHIKLNLQFPGMGSDSIPATFAVSVTDDKDVKPDTTINILAEVLLSSELKGKINHPAWYINDKENIREAADLLMLTHGWRNYHVPEALQGNIQLLKHKPETSQSLSGMLKTKRGRPSDFGIIKMTALGYDFSETIEADEKGYYIFNDFEFPDSTAYHLYANNKKRKTDVEIHPDEISYPGIKPDPNSIKTQEPQIDEIDFVKFLAKADNKYIMENGMRLILLDEVTIKGKRRRRLDNLTPISFPSSWISPDQIEKFPLQTFQDLHQRLGIYDSSGFIYVIDGKVLNSFTPSPIQDIENLINLEDIAQAELLKCPDQTFPFTKTSYQVIVITTWPPGDPRRRNPNLFSTVILPLGYQKPVEFYSPQYETMSSVNDPDPDLRSTIYWKPNGIVNSDNKAFIEFYAADATTSYSIVIEGIGNNGELIYHKQDALINIE